MHWLGEAAVSALIVIGAFFLLVGSYALAKLPDTMRRLLGPTKAATLGIGAQQNTTKHNNQHALPAPSPRVGIDFNAEAAERGDALFSGKGKCSTCHMEPTWTDSGWNMHTPAEVCVDSFQADRAPDHMYRTSPLGGLWTHTLGGFYHDGRFATLDAVVDHYDTFFKLEHTTQQKHKKEKNHKTKKQKQNAE